MDEFSKVLVEDTELCSREWKNSTLIIQLVAVLSLGFMS